LQLQILSFSAPADVGNLANRPFSIVGALAGRHVQNRRFDVSQAADDPRRRCSRSEGAGRWLLAAMRLN
jgi:hypothetical protein